MSESSPAVDFTPTNVATIYLVVGGAWIALSDRLVAVVLPQGELYVLAQTTKGWLFVVGSTALIFSLMRRREQRLTHANGRLEAALRQVSILHHILRHNLRNSCNVIDGTLSLIDTKDSDTERVETIESHVEKLTNLSRKSSRLTDIVLADDASLVEVDLGDTLERQVEQAAEAYPRATFEVDAPGAVRVRVLPKFETAIAELLENAVKHAEDPHPTVRVAVSTNPDETVTVEVSDEGPGLPDVEKAVLEEGVERPLAHSEGVGLWLIRVLVIESGGTLRVATDHSSGTRIRLTLPDATAA